MILTNFFAEYFGLVLTIFSISLFVHKDMYMEIVHDIEHKRGAIYAIFFVTLLFGLLAVLLHNIWHGSSLTVIVTIVAWVVLIKSILFLVLPTKTTQHIVRRVAFAKNYQLYAIISLLVGLYLLVASFA